MLIKFVSGRMPVCPSISMGYERLAQCRGTGCMAWREHADGLGYCGMAQKPLQVVCTELVAASAAIRGQLEGGAA